MLFSEPQVEFLELSLLQVYFHLRRDERADDGGGRALVYLVHRPWLHPTALRIRKRTSRIRTTAQNLATA